MNVLTIAALGFVVAVDRCGVLLRVPFIGEAWWDLSGQGLSCFDSWRRRGGRARQRRVIGHWLGAGAGTCLSRSTLAYRGASYRGAQQVGVEFTAGRVGARTQDAVLWQ